MAMEIELYHTDPLDSQSYKSRQTPKYRGKSRKSLVSKQEIGEDSQIKYKKEAYVSLNSPRWDEIYDNCLFHILYMAYGTKEIVNILGRNFGFRTTENICNKKIKAWVDGGILPPRYHTARYVETSKSIVHLTTPLPLGLDEPDPLLLDNTFLAPLVMHVKDWAPLLESLATDTNRPCELSEARVLTLLWLVEKLPVELCGEMARDQISYERFLSYMPKPRAASIRKLVENIEIPPSCVHEERLCTVLFNSQRLQERLVSYTQGFVSIVHPPVHFADTPKRQLCETADVGQSRWEEKDVESFAHIICRSLPQVFYGPNPSLAVFESLEKLVPDGKKTPTKNQMADYDGSVSEVLKILESLKNEIWEQMLSVLAPRQSNQLSVFSKLKWGLRLTMQLIGIYRYNPTTSGSELLLQGIFEKLRLGCQNVGVTEIMPDRTDSIDAPNPNPPQNTSGSQSSQTRNSSRRQWTEEQFQQIENPYSHKSDSPRYRRSSLVLCCHCGNGPSTKSAA